MNIRFLGPIGIAAILAGLVGCKRGSSSDKDATQSPSPTPVVQATRPIEGKSEPIVFPDLGPSRLIQPGIQFREATLRRGSVPMRIWYYQPEKVSGKMALVLIPPAGSTLFVGMGLADGDRAEHYPYAKAGFAVASFEIDGHVPNLESAPDAIVLNGARQFRDAQAGIANAKVTLDFILAKVPEIDPSRIHIAGHSSAATLALLAASQEPRITACAAYAPATDVDARLAPAIPALDRAIPGYREFLHFSSPKTHVAELKCPVFLFHAEDDSTIPISQTRQFAALLKKTNPNVTLVTTPKGGHYESMISEGIPKGIEWLRQVKK
jgi:dipeptidyl aminopeptidase/acylaminoacyl peptidase